MKAGTCPPPDVTLASPDGAEAREEAGDAPAEEIRREVDQHVALDDRRRRSQTGNVSRRMAIRSWATQPRSDSRERARDRLVPRALRAVSQPSVTPVPPYSSFGFSTKRSRLRRR